LGCCGVDARGALGAVGGGDAVGGEGLEPVVGEEGPTGVADEDAGAVGDGALQELLDAVGHGFGVEDISGEDDVGVAGGGVEQVGVAGGDGHVVGVGVEHDGAVCVWVGVVGFHAGRAG